MKNQTWIKLRISEIEEDLKLLAYLVSEHGESEALMRAIQHRDEELAEIYLLTEWEE